MLRGLDRWQLADSLIERRQDPGRADRLLAALVRLARNGDDEAARLLLAALTPEIGRLARRYARTLGYDEATAVAVAAIWDRVARFEPPVSHIAYRLVWLAGRRVYQAATAERGQAARSQDLTDLATGAVLPADLPEHVLLGHAADAGVVSRRAAWLTWATHCGDLTLTQAGEVLGLRYDAAKKCRQRANGRLRSWLEGAE